MILIFSGYEYESGGGAYDLFLTVESIEQVALPPSGDWAHAYDAGRGEIVAEWLWLDGAWRDEVEVESIRKDRRQEAADGYSQLMAAGKPFYTDKLRRWHYVPDGHGGADFHMGPTPADLVVGGRITDAEPPQ